MVTGDVVLEGFLVKMFYNVSINPETEDQPTHVGSPWHKLFLLCCILSFFSLWIWDTSNSLHNWALWFVYADSDHRINDYLELKKKKTNEKTGINQEHLWIKTLNIHT